MDDKLYSLQLTQDEADVLMTVLRNISGYPNGSRGETSSILKKLSSEGIEETQYKQDVDGDRVGKDGNLYYRGSIEFLDGFNELPITHEFVNGEE